MPNSSPNYVKSDFGSTGSSSASSGRRKSALGAGSRLTVAELALNALRAVEHQRLVRSVVDPVRLPAFLIAG